MRGTSYGSIRSALPTATTPSPSELPQLSPRRQRRLEAGPGLELHLQSIPTCVSWDLSAVRAGRIVIVVAVYHNRLVPASRRQHRGRGRQRTSPARRNTRAASPGGRVVLESLRGVLLAPVFVTAGRVRGIADGRRLALLPLPLLGVALSRPLPRLSTALRQGQIMPRIRFTSPSRHSTRIGRCC